MRAVFEFETARRNLINHGAAVAPKVLGKNAPSSKFLDSRGRKRRFFARLPTADRGFRPRLLKIFLLQRFFPKLFGATATRGTSMFVQQTCLDRPDIQRICQIIDGGKLDLAARRRADRDAEVTAFTTGINGCFGYE